MRSGRVPFARFDVNLAFGVFSGVSFGDLLGVSFGVLLGVSFGVCFGFEGVFGGLGTAFRFPIFFSLSPVPSRVVRSGGSGEPLCCGLPLGSMVGSPFGTGQLGSPYDLRASHLVGLPRMGGGCGE